MALLNIVIIEDEPATARNLHATLLDTDEDINLLVTLNAVKNAVEWLLANDGAYDLVFMDIRLSDGSSFDIIEQVKINSPIIFVTAYDDYALQAFKTNSIDYILKPFEKADLQQALQKFSILSTATAKDYGQLNLAAITSLIKSGIKNYRQSFLFQFRDKLIPVASKDIAWFYTLNELCHVCSIDNRKFIVEFTLEQLQQQLDPQHFFRANRQFIVQRKSIAEIEFFFNGRLLVKVEPEAPEKILISKARVPEFKAWMNV